MRITAGSARGRVLKTREGNATRPTDARARETLFNVIGERIVEARFLDLYGGSGAVGLEALSRGAHSCVFVEQNAPACRIIRENANALGFVEDAQIWHSNVRAALHKLLQNEACFDIIFADPPFHREAELPELGAALDNSAQLLHNVDGRFAPLLVVQHHRKAGLQLNGFALQQERRAGESVLSFFTLNQN